MEKWEFQNHRMKPCTFPEDEDEPLVREEPALREIPAEFPGIEIEAMAGSDEMVETPSTSNGTDNCPEAALAMARNADLDDPRNAPEDPRNIMKDNEEKYEGLNDDDNISFDEGAND